MHPLIADEGDPEGILHLLLFFIASLFYPDLTVKFTDTGYLFASNMKTLQLLLVVGIMVTASPIDRDVAQLHRLKTVGNPEPGYNPVMVKPLGGFAGRVLQAGTTHSAPYGRHAAGVGITNTAQALFSGGFVGAGVPTVASELVQAVRAGAFERFGGRDSPFGRWDAERRKVGQEWKQAIIEGAQRLGEWFEQFMQGYVVPPTVLVPPAPSTASALPDLPDIPSGPHHPFRPDHLSRNRNKTETPVGDVSDRPPGKCQVRLPIVPSPGPSCVHGRPPGG